MASLVAGTAGGALAVVSLLVALLESLADGAAATEGAVSVAALGIEGADSALDGAVVLVLDATELCAVVLVLGADGVGALRLVERLELALGAGLVAGAAFGAGVTAAVVSATVTGFSAGAPISAGATIEGAAPASATLAGCVAGSGTFTSLSLRLWSTSSAPPMTDAVMMPNASPK